MAKVAVSILDADFGSLQKEVDKVSNADFLHLDVMDGHFVDNITFGTYVIKAIKTKLQKNVHLMIENPEKYWESFADAGAEMIIVHLEACKDMDPLIKAVRKRGLKFGIALKQETELHWIRYYLDKIDMVLLMAIEPGRSGQNFIYKTLDRISELREMTNIDIAVDGGINEETGKLCALAGANILSSSSFIFRSNDPAKQVEILKNI